MSDKQIISTPSLFAIDETFDDPRFMKVRIKTLHDGENLKKSDFIPESLEDAKDSFANIPILANIQIYTDDDGNEYMDYGGHDMHKEADAFHEGEKRIIYDEKVVGVVPEDCNFEIIYDKKEDKNFIWVDALIYRDYGNYCADILEERGGTTSVSAEVEFLDTSYDAKRKFIIVNKFRMLGVTLLGEDVQPAMKGANASAFALEEDTRQEQLVNVMKELTEALNKYTATFADNSKRKEEKDKLNTELFNKLCEQYSVSESDITFEYSELEDEALEAAFAEHFDGDGDSSESTDSTADSSDAEAAEEAEAEDSGASDGGDTEESNDVSVPANALDASNDEIGNEDEEDQNELEANNSYPSGSKLYQVDYKLTNGEETRNFSISMNEEIAALTDLFNATYCEEDNDWYYVEAYADTKTIVAHGWYKHYKQKYTVKDGVYSLKGDRVEVYAQYLTQEEIDALEGLKSKFEVADAKLQKYESEPEKIEILSSDDWNMIKDTEEYAELAKRENYFELTKEELTEKLTNTLTEYAKKFNKAEFAAKANSEEPKVEEPKKDFFAFARFETKSSFLDGLLSK